MSACWSSVQCYWTVSHACGGVAARVDRRQRQYHGGNGVGGHHHQASALFAAEDLAADHVGVLKVGRGEGGAVESAWLIVHRPLVARVAAAIDRGRHKGGRTVGADASGLVYNAHARNHGGLHHKGLADARGSARSAHHEGGGVGARRGKAYAWVGQGAGAWASAREGPRVGCSQGSACGSAARSWHARSIEGDAARRAGTVGGNEVCRRGYGAGFEQPEAIEVEVVASGMPCFNFKARRARKSAQEDAVATPIRCRGRNECGGLRAARSPVQRSRFKARGQEIPYRGTAGLKPNFDGIACLSGRNQAVGHVERERRAAIKAVNRRDQGIALAGGSEGQRKVGHAHGGQVAVAGGRCKRLPGGVAVGVFDGPALVKSRNESLASGQGKSASGNGLNSEGGIAAVHVFCHEANAVEPNLADHQLGGGRIGSNERGAGTRVNRPVPSRDQPYRRILELDGVAESAG